MGIRLGFARNIDLGCLGQEITNRACVFLNRLDSGGIGGGAVDANGQTVAVGTCITGQIKRTGKQCMGAFDYSAGDVDAEGTTRIGLSRA